MRAILLAACAIGAAPLVALLALALVGLLAAGPALLAVAWVSAASLLLALLGARDARRFWAALRRVADDPTAPPAEDGAPRLPGLADLAPEAQRLVRSLARRAARTEALRRADQAVVERLADPLLILGADLRLRRANRAAVSEFGTEAAALLRHPVLRGAVERALEAGAPQEVELSLPVPVPRELRATVSLLDPEPGGDRVVVLLADRTRERAVERMRADFVANAGHELRTPLASLVGFIETLRGPAADDPAAQQRFLGIMAEQAGRMQRLIADLLSLSRIELAEHQRPADRVDLADLAEQVAAGFEPVVRAGLAVLDLVVDPAAPAVAGDADQLAQVVQNLLDNALRHGGEGVRVRLAVAPARAGERWPARPGAVLTVGDDGPGIPREHLPRLTERFYRVDTARSRAAGGTGLGLAIVKHIVNRHRGQLRIESADGRGSTFSLWLPAASGADPEPASATAAARPHG